MKVQPPYIPFAVKWYDVHAMCVFVPFIKLKFSPSYSFFPLFRWDSPLKLIGSGMDSAPLTLFNRTKHSMMMSTFNEFTVNSMVHDPLGDILMFGVEGKIKEIPKGFVHQSILHYGTGIKEVHTSH